jgi:filamentous hemagglutinin
VASLNRDTANAQVTAQRFDGQAMAQRAQVEQAIKTQSVAEAAKFTDEAYKKMFLTQVDIYKIKRDENGNVKLNEKTGLPEYVMLSPEQKQNLSPSNADDKVHIANNGIFNDLDGAAKYANQHSTSGTGEQYFIYAPKADNPVSEFVIAGYQKFLEGNTLGLTNATQENVNAINQYGQSGLQLDGHSRGALTTMNAMQSVEQQSNAQGSMSGSTVNFYGPAANVQNADAVLSNLQNRQAMTPDQQNAATLHYECQVGDPVCRLPIVGNNASTGGTIPPDSNIIKEGVRAITGSTNTTHNCYGTNNKDGQCDSFWNNQPNKLPTLVPVPQPKLIIPPLTGNQTPPPPGH